NHLRLYVWLLLPAILLVPLTFACIIYYNVPINDSIVLLIINTNINEASELLKSFALPFLVIILITFLIYFSLVSKVPKQISFKTSVIISLCPLFIILTFPFYDGNQSTYFKRMRGRFYTLYPTSLIYSVGSVFKQYELMNSSKKERDSFTFHAKSNLGVHQKQIYVLVLDESLRYDHLGINGYYRNTTPKLSKQQNLISFSNTNTGAFITEYSIPLIITGLDPHNFDEHYKQKSIVSVFKEAGYKTYWITNQQDNGHIKIHIEEADEKYLLMSDFKATKNIHRSSELLQIFDSVLNEPGDKKFIVLHRLGSHYDYSLRYRDAYDIFKPSNKMVFSQATDFNSKNIIINSYDNSILSTDNVVDSVITMVNSYKSVSSVCFISDHGENLFDDARHLSQHGYPVPSKYVAHIPFIIWYSDSLKEIIPQKIKTLKENRSKKSSSENLFYTYTDLCGISFDKDDSTRSLCSPKYKEQPRYVLGGGFIVYNSDSLK
ncbi:MAG: sulfatase-like hydrolase/transferase, partial [Bacteroidota bacterium]|nr:sulfatase-like hydrolase/transferase [Bacteroidota bacterium]